MTNDFWPRYGALVVFLSKPCQLIPPCKAPVNKEPHRGSITGIKLEVAVAANTSVQFLNEPLVINIYQTQVGEI